MIAPQAPRLGVIDIGSNTIRLLVADVTGDALKSVLDKSEFVALGRGVDANQRLADDRVAAALQAIDDLAEKAHNKGATDVFAIATSAVRDAGNGPAFLRELVARTGIDVRLITGDEEALFAVRGTMLGMDTAQQRIVVMDLGGGSGQIVGVNNGAVEWERSLQIGSNRMTERFIHSDPPVEEEMDALRSWLAGQFADLPRYVPDKLVVTGGTASHVVSLAGRKGKRVALAQHALETVTAAVVQMPLRSLVAKYDIRPERAHVLPAGVITLQAVVDFYAKPPIIVSRTGVREGAILERIDARGAL